MVASATATKQAQDTESFMKSLEVDTFNILGGIDNKTTAKSGMEDQLNKLETNITDAMKQKDDRSKEVRLRVAKSTSAELVADVAQEERDFAQAVTGLRELMERIGADYTGLTETSVEEKSLVSNAEYQLRSIEGELPGAQVAWFFRQRKIAAVQSQIQNAKDMLEAAKAKSQSLARSRLMNATIDKSLQHFITQVARAVDNMERRYKSTCLELQTVSERRQKALTTKELAAAKLEELDQQLTDFEGKLRLAEQEFGSLTNGTQEFVAKESEVMQLRNQVEEVRGNRNAALALYQSKERFAEELQIHETAQRKLRDNQKIWITVLKSDTQERVITFHSRLEAMKAMSDQTVARDMDKIGTEMDGRNAEFMATAGAVSDRVRQDMIDSQPARLKRIAVASGAQAESLAIIREREVEALAEFRRRYGIDPSADSFFTYAGKGEAAPAA